MFEDKHQKIAPQHTFLRRMGLHFGIAFLLMLGALLIGVVGYHSLAKLDWVDSFLNASMILSGMGQIDALPSPDAKVFASFYALFCGLIFIAMMGIIFAPIMHRVLHKFHMDK